MRNNSVHLAASQTVDAHTYLFGFLRLSLSLFFSHALHTLAHKIKTAYSTCVHLSVKINGEFCKPNWMNEEQKNGNNYTKSKWIEWIQLVKVTTYNKSQRSHIASSLCSFIPLPLSCPSLDSSFSFLYYSLLSFSFTCSVCLYFICRCLCKFAAELDSLCWESKCAALWNMVQKILLPFSRIYEHIAILKIVNNNIWKNKIKEIGSFASSIAELNRRENEE